MGKFDGRVNFDCAQLKYSGGVFGIWFMQGLKMNGRLQMK